MYIRFKELEVELELYTTVRYCIKRNDLLHLMEGRKYTTDSVTEQFTICGVIYSFEMGW